MKILYFIIIIKGNIMIAEVYWWAEEIAVGIKGKHRGIDIIDDSNIKDFSSLACSDRFANAIDIEDITIDDVISAMDIVGEFAQDCAIDDLCLMNFSGTVSIMAMPNDWGVTCLKFKKNRDDKRAQRVIK